jgi:uncharacterized iron-regulated membrane protein
VPQFDSRFGGDEALDEPRHHPKLAWAKSHEKRPAAMDCKAKERGFTIVRPFIFSHELDFGFYRYQVESSLDPSSRCGENAV